LNSFLQECAVPLLARRRVASRLLAVFALALCTLPAARPALADDGAAALIKKTAEEVIGIITTKTGADRQAGIQKVLETDFDLAAMGRSSLGTHWNQASPEEQQRFLKAVASSEARAYSERFGQYGGQTLAIGRVTDRGNGVSIVESKLNQKDGQPINIQWEVRNEGQGPRITDVKIEGVSMIMTRRSDFNSYISNHGGQVGPLINELESRAK
jgi:phospholipid transport system substrate-binding protein